MKQLAAVNQRPATSDTVKRFCWLWTSHVISAAVQTSKRLAFIVTF